MPSCLPKLMWRQWSFSNIICSWRSQLQRRTTRTSNVIATFTWRRHYLPIALMTRSINDRWSRWIINNNWHWHGWKWRRECNQLRLRSTAAGADTSWLHWRWRCACTLHVFLIFLKKPLLSRKPHFFSSGSLEATTGMTPHLELDQLDLSTLTDKRSGHLSKYLTCNWNLSKFTKKKVFWSLSPHSIVHRLIHPIRS